MEALESSVSRSDRTVDDLIQRIREGDSAAFAHLVRSNQAYAFALAFRMLTDEDEARDAVQEAFIRVWKNLEKYDPSRKFTTWLYAIVSRICLDRLRSRSRQTRFFRRATEERSFDHVPDPLDTEARYSNQEIAKIISRLSEHLSTTQKLVFTLRDLQECSIQEVCDITGLSEGSIKTNLSLARKKIRNLLAQQYDIHGSQA